MSDTTHTKKLAILYDAGIEMLRGPQTRHGVMSVIFKYIMEEWMNGCSWNLQYMSDITQGNILEMLHLIPWKEDFCFLFSGSMFVSNITKGNWFCEIFRICQTWHKKQLATLFYAALDCFTILTETGRSGGFSLLIHPSDITQNYIFATVPWGCHVNEKIICWKRCKLTVIF